MANGLGGGGIFVPAKMCLDELADLTVSPLPSLHVTKYFFFVESFYLFIYILLCLARISSHLMLLCLSFQFNRSA